MKLWLIFQILLSLEYRTIFVTFNTIKYINKYISKCETFKFQDGGECFAPPPLPLYKEEVLQVYEISHDLVEVFPSSEDTDDYNILKSDFPGKLSILLNIFIT